jgi:hypothetical protein
MPDLAYKILTAVTRSQSTGASARAVTESLLGFCYPFPPAAGAAPFRLKRS